MKCLERNRIQFWYSLYLGKTEIKDEYGNATGQYTINRAEPVVAYGNISPARGQSTDNQFGEALKYDKVIVLEDTPIDEFSVLWVDTPYASGVPHDYEVSKVARSLNSVSLAVRKVNVS